MVLVTKRSAFSGKVHQIELPMSDEQYDECMDKYEHGALIQEAFPMLNDEQREFLLSGVTQEEWDEAFPEEDDEDASHMGNDDIAF